MKSHVSVAVSLALATVVLTAFGPASAGPRPIEAIPSASGELTALADLVVMLKQELHGVERHLVAECDAGEVRDHLISVRNQALQAVNRLGGLWQTGRLRSGALAASEALTRDLVVLIYEAHDAAVLAQASAGLRNSARRTPEGRADPERGVEIRQPVCGFQPFAAGEKRR